MNSRKDIERIGGRVQKGKWKSSKVWVYRGQSPVGRVQNGK